jgi:hypothetical protein
MQAPLKPSLPRDAVRRFDSTGGEEIFVDAES